MNSVERVADGSLSLHDYPFSPAALDAIALQRVYAALDLTRSRRTLYPSASSSSWGRLQPSLRDVRAARPPADDRRSFRVGHVSGRRDAGRWSPPGFSSSARKQFVGWRISPSLLPRPFALMSEWLSVGRQCQRTARRRLLPCLQHVRPVAVSAAWTVGCVGAFIGLAQRTGASPAGQLGGGTARLTSTIASVAGVQRLGRFRH